MRIEFLQVEKDTDAFIDYVYNSQYCLSRRRLGKDHVFSREMAKAVLNYDLYCLGSPYYISTNQDPNNKLLELFSCGNESLPWGNTVVLMAGQIVEMRDCEPASAVRQAFLLMKKYFKSHYVFDYYHKESKMKCYYGPAYLLQKAEASLTGERYAGTINLFFKESININIADELEMLKKLTNIEIRNQYTVHCWYAQDVVWMGIQFLHTNSIEIHDLTKLAQKLLKTEPMVEDGRRWSSIISDNFYTGVSETEPVSLLFLLEKPFVLSLL